MIRSGFKMKRIAFVSFSLLILLLCAGCGGSATSGNNNVGTSSPSGTPSASSGQSASEGLSGAQHIRFASHNLNTGWYAYAASMAEVLRESLPSGSTIDVLPYAASIGNIDLLRKKEAELGFTFGLVARWAENGEGVFEGKADSSVRALIGGLDEYYAVVIARKDVAINNLSEVREKQMPVRIVTTEKGSLAASGGDTILKAYGIEPDELKRWGGSLTNTTQDALVSDMKDGRADILIHTINAGHPALTELTTSADVKFLQLDDDVIEQMKAVGYKESVLPANTFKGQTEDVKVGGTSTGIFTHDTLDDDLAYTITKIISENKDKLAASNKALGAYDPTKAWEKGNIGGIGLHPGAERYFREQGWMK